MKQHHRLSCDRLTSSTTPLDSSFEITPAVHLVGQKGRRESTDSGLASVGANKRQSVDSEVLSRQTTQSEHSSPGTYCGVRITFRVAESQMDGSKCRIVSHVDGFKNGTLTLILVFC